MLLTNTDLIFLTYLIILLYLKLLEMMVTLVTFSMHGIKHQHIKSIISLKVATNVRYIPYCMYHTSYCLLYTSSSISVTEIFAEVIP